MKKLIVITLRFEGFHCWPEAPKEVDFLAHRHRHIFHIKCEVEVSHNDRDIEIILFKREVVDYLIRNYGQTNNLETRTTWLEFGRMSCEDIAQDLIEAFNLSSCEVLEDGENGAKLINNK